MNGKVNKYVVMIIIQLLLKTSIKTNNEFHSHLFHVRFSHMFLILHLKKEVRVYSKILTKCPSAKNLKKKKKIFIYILP